MSGWRNVDADGLVPAHRVSTGAGGTLHLLCAQGQAHAALFKHHPAISGSTLRVRVSTVSPRALPPPPRAPGRRTSHQHAAGDIYSPAVVDAVWLASDKRRASDVVRRRSLACVCPACTGGGGQQLLIDETYDVACVRSGLVAVSITPGAQHAAPVPATRASGITMEAKQALARELSMHRSTPVEAHARLKAGSGDGPGPATLAAVQCFAKQHRKRPRVLGGGPMPTGQQAVEMVLAPFAAGRAGVPAEVLWYQAPHPHLPWDSDDPAAATHIFVVGDLPRFCTSAVADGVGSVIGIDGKVNLVAGGFTTVPVSLVRKGPPVPRRPCARVPDYGEPVGIGLTTSENTEWHSGVYDCLEQALPCGPACSHGLTTVALAHGGFRRRRECWAAAGRLRFKLFLGDLLSANAAAITQRGGLHLVCHFHSIMAILDWLTAKSKGLTPCTLVAVCIVVKALGLLEKNAHVDALLPDAKSAIKALLPGQVRRALR